MIGVRSPTLWNDDILPEIIVLSCLARSSSSRDGFSDGTNVCSTVGYSLGVKVTLVGSLLGVLVGNPLGDLVGFFVGNSVGDPVGYEVGVLDGSSVDNTVGALDGYSVGVVEGEVDGITEGSDDGEVLGEEEGITVGN